MDDVLGSLIFLMFNDNDAIIKYLDSIYVVPHQARGSDKYIYELSSPAGS